MRLKGLGQLDIPTIRAISVQQRLARLPGEKTDSGKYLIRPTVQFIKDLATMLSERWGKPVTPTQAWQVWIAAAVIETRADERGREDAELAFWYGVNPFSLSERQRETLYFNLPRIKAQHQLSNQHYDPTDYHGVYDLVMMAYDDEAMALEARSDAIQRATDKAAARKG